MRDDKYIFKGAIELDDVFFSTETPLKKQGNTVKTQPLKPKKAKTLMMAESKTVENPRPSKKPKEIKHLNMKAINGLKVSIITKNVKEHVERTADLTTDDSTSYTKLKKIYPFAYGIRYSTQGTSKCTALDVYRNQQC